MISVIIPAKNAADTIEGCLNALIRQEGLEIPYEVIVVDDGSTDDTNAIVERFGVKIIRLEGEGPAAARNTGAEAAKGEILAFTDPDCEPAEDWIEELTKPFADQDVVGVRGAYRTRQSGLVPRFVQQEYAFKYERMARREAIDFIDTYSAAYRRDVFFANGGFDTVFKVPSVEDQEFSFRLARKGYRMVFAPQAVVFHRHVHNLWEYCRRKFRIGYGKALMLRWLPEKTFSDTHTPGTQRLQVGLFGLALGCALLAVAWPIFWLIALGLIGLFALTAIPFMVFIARNDWGVLIIAPLLILARAAALDFGLFTGFLFPRVNKSEYSTSITFLSRSLKRGLDLVGSLFGLVLSAPFIALAALAVKFDSSGPAFFVQERVGENGKTFHMVKLRTMVVGAESHVEQVLATNPLQGPVFKIPSDPRVTRVGRFLRRWSIDEIPQLWNVLRGEMSLVGPRPEESWVVAQYNNGQRARLAVKPGLTGPMQVYGRGDLDMDARLALELDYMENYSIWRDFKILLRSVPAIISGKGAY